MLKKKNVTRDAVISDICKKEITIPLPEYTDLIAKETVLAQIIYAITKSTNEYSLVPVLKAILQIDTPEDKK